jgi:integrase/recombinase XerC
MGDRHLRLVQANQQQGRQNEMFNEMLRGYATMLLAAGRDRGSVGKLLQMLRGFVVWADAWPWEWTAQDVDEWSADMRDRGLALSTLRNRQGVVRRFCEYAVNPQYPWLERCREEFGQVPEQVCHEWNTIRHIEEYDHLPERREISRDELRTLFDHVDDRVERMVNANHKSAAISWRDATMFKVQYGTGLRPFELVQLQTCDLLPHPVAPRFGRYAVVRVRWGKRSKGGTYRQRGVQMVLEWVVEAVRVYVEDIRSVFPDGPWLWPSERRDSAGRQQQVGVRTYQAAFAARRDACGLDEALTPHCMRHSYLTHTAEAGRDPAWRQRQAGHKLMSTTSVYTHTSEDFMNREMRAAIADLTGKRGSEP